MPWFRVDDSLYGHPKWLSASPAAKALWVTAGSWSMAHGTDGKVPPTALPLLGSKPRVAQELVELGLWHQNGVGWYFHDWNGYQPTAAEIEAAREAESASGRRGNHLRWHVKKGVVNPDCEYCQEGSHA